MGRKVRSARSVPRHRVWAPGHRVWALALQWVEREEGKSLEIRTTAGESGGLGARSLPSDVCLCPKPSLALREEERALAPVLILQPRSPSLLRTPPHRVLVWGGLQMGLVGSLPGTCKPSALQLGA